MLFPTNLTRGIENKGWRSHDNFEECFPLHNEIGLALKMLMYR